MRKTFSSFTSKSLSSAYTSSYYRSIEFHSSICLIVSSGFAEMLKLPCMGFEPNDFLSSVLHRPHGWLSNWLSKLCINPSDDVVYRWVTTTCPSALKSPAGLEGSRPNKNLSQGILKYWEDVPEN